MVRTVDRRLTQLEELAEAYSAEFPDMGVLFVGVDFSDDEDAIRVATNVYESDSSIDHIALPRR